MLLAIDIGNTYIHCGLFKGNKLYRQWVVSKIAFIKQYKSVKAVVMSSVVPELSPVVKIKFTIPVLEVSADIDLGIKIKYRYPKQVGADRLANAAACKYIYGGPAVIVDFGTAVTIDAVSSSGDYLGGIILPGMDIARKGLALNTALLPLVPMKHPKKILGRDTKTAIQSGLYYGFSYMIKGLITSLKKELRFSKKTVIIGTGGYASFMKSKNMIVDPALTLKGLRLIYERNRSKKYY